jgi:hypothetical protein
VRAWKPPAKVAQPEGTTDEPVAAEPQAEPNPYDAQREDDSANAKPPSPSHGSGLDLESVLREEASPGP